ncbi:MAG: glucose-6-phosphate dehydrogenase [Bacteroidetes bacterium]|nr:MAG: glucose-6-phosphate dehydrogenase [Bacteroidota bacterium]PTM14915.1 MAG: glucose-6-phosphate dehydrogenase [Bacteroidota bacterium]
MDSHIFVIFGASGDLATRKLIPAFFKLYQGGYLPEKFALLGVSRTDLSDDDFRTQVVTNSQFLPQDADPDALRNFAKLLYYQPIDTAVEADYAKVKTRLQELDDRHGTPGNYIFYLSTPPKLYETVPAYLSAQGLNESKGRFRRLVIEKPFGYDGESARQLNMHLLRFFLEDQIYRIDHYLGKETVQNLLVTRFANGIYEPLWNRNYIHHVQITSAENIGVQNRGGYYNESGALRDMIQNHLLQIVAHIAMEPPVSSDSKAIRNEKLKLFQSLRPILPEEMDKYVIRGQYTSSNIKEERAQGYREEKGVPTDSRTETYVAMKFFIDNWRWSDVPFYLRTGKRMPTKVTEVVITFKPSPQRLFRSEETFNNPYNQLIIRIQPHEGLALRFGMKVPGQGFKVKDVDMDFHYADLTDAEVPEAYERLILDCMRGDGTLYSLGESVEAAWKFVDPILDAWEANETKLFGYPAGTWGPKEAENLFTNGSAWRNPCKNLTNMSDFCEL